MYFCQSVSGRNWPSLSRVMLSRTALSNRNFSDDGRGPYLFLLISCSIFYKEKLPLNNYFATMKFSIYRKDRKKLLTTYSLLSAVRIISCFLFFLKKWYIFTLLWFWLLSCILFYCSHSCWGSNLSILGWKGFTQISSWVFKRWNSISCLLSEIIFVEICAS